MRGSGVSKLPLDAMQHIYKIVWEDLPLCGCGNRMTSMPSTRLACHMTTAQTSAGLDTPSDLTLGY